MVTPEILALVKAILEREKACIALDIEIGSQADLYGMLRKLNVTPDSERNGPQYHCSRRLFQVV